MGLTTDSYPHLGEDAPHTQGVRGILVFWLRGQIPSCNAPALAATTASQRVRKISARCTTKLITVAVPWAITNATGSAHRW